MAMKRPVSPLQVKSEAFSKRIIRLHTYLLREKNERVMANQIYRSGTSIGANIAESRYAQSSLDFVSKLSIALKVASESRYWLNSIFSAGLIDQVGYDSMAYDNDELIKMLTSSVNTMKEKLGLQS